MLIRGDVLNIYNVEFKASYFARSANSRKFTALAFGMPRATPVPGGSRMKIRDLIKLVEKDGWCEVRVKGGLVITTIQSSVVSQP